MARISGVNLPNKPVAIALTYIFGIGLNCVLASDAFFPFRDNIDFAASKVALHIIQPGGSVKDEDVIKAAEEKNLTMTFTGVRHFKH